LLVVNVVFDHCAMTLAIKSFLSYFNK